jgi:hypothetical protein
MKRTLLLAALLTSLSATQAQQSVPREEALKAAFLLAADLKQMLATPIPTDPDLKRPVSVRAAERGGMVLPECKLSPDKLAKVGKDVVSVGQLWLHRVVPQNESQAVKQDKLLSVTVGNGDESATVWLCALGVRKDAEGKPELLIYGKEKEPVMCVPLKSISAQQEDPIELSAEPQGNSALVTLKIVGKCEAQFTVFSE